MNLGRTTSGFAHTKISTGANKTVTCLLEEHARAKSGFAQNLSNETLGGPTIEQSKRYQAGYEKACRNDEISHQMISGAREAVAFWSMRGDGSADYWRGWLAGLIKSQTTTAS